MSAMSIDESDLGGGSVERRALYNLTAAEVDAVHLVRGSLGHVRDIVGDDERRLSAVGARGVRELG